MKRIRVRDFFLLTIMAVSLAACGGSDREEGVKSAGLLSAANSRFNTYELAKTDPAATFSAGLAINRNNAVIGVSDGASGAVRGAAWTVSSSGSTFTGTTLPLPPGAGAWSAAYGINDVGAIVGEFESSPGGGTVAAFWASRTSLPQRLASLDSAPGGAAYALNAVGRIVGEAHFPSPRGFDTAAVTWASRSSFPTRLPVPVGTISSSAFSINRIGDIVGEITDSSETKAVLWRPVSGRYLNVLLLPAPGNSTALTVSDLGVIAGETAGSDGKTRAVRWIPAGGTLFTRIDLGTGVVSSSAAGINRGALTVGNVKGGDELVSTATAWDGTTNEPSPVAPDYAFSQAYSANDSGLTVGMGDGEAFVAVPK